MSGPGYGFVLGVTLGAAGVGIAALIANPSLTAEFQDAAEVGQVTQAQGQSACKNSEKKLNRELHNARQGHKAAPVQYVDFKCGNVVVVTAASPAPSGP